MKRHIIFLLFLATTVIGIFAVPAYRGPILYTQPDGTVVTLCLEGDGESHRVFSVDGYLLIGDGTGAYHYASVDDNQRIVSSEILARNPEQRNAATVKMLRKNKELIESALETHRPNRLPSVGLFPGTSYPSTGSPKALVILVEYDDVPFTLEKPFEYFSDLLNKKGFDEYGATGSVLEWFTENSNGAFTPQFDLYGPVKLGGKRSNYGGNNASGTDMSPHHMVIEACQQLDDTVDFSQYDTDGDGFIDNVFVFYAGVGENLSGVEEAVWPHTSYISKLEFTNYVFDGVTLNRYACTNEWVRERPDGIGTFCHEFSHVMGLPDLYNTSLGSMNYTPGAWSVMDYGPYNNEGRTPPLYSSFERLALGWLSPEALEQDRSYGLEPLSSNQAYTVSKNDNEFFLFENRQQQGWDAYLPGHGMLVWHIEYDDDTWNSRRVNNDENHQRVDLVEADNLLTYLSRGGDAFPGTQGVDELAWYTTPALRYRNGTSAGVALTAIREHAFGTITFRVGTGSEAPQAVELNDVENITPNSLTLSWTPSPQASSYLLWARSAGETILEEVNMGNVLSYTVTGLTPDTDYTFEVCAFDGCELSEASNTVSATTLPPTVDYFKSEIVSLSQLTDSSIEVVWNDIAPATDYQLSVCRLERGEPYTTVADFTDGLNSLPDGWETNSRLTYAMGSYSGAAPMSLRLSADKDYLTTGVLDAEVYSLSFWHRGSSTGADDTIALEIYTGGEWHLLNTYPIVTAQGGTTIEVDFAGKNARGVRLSFNRSAGSLAIDDVVLCWGGDISALPVDGYQWRSMGNATTATVEGLIPGSDYSVTVRATDGELFSTPAEAKIISLLSSIMLPEAVQSGSKYYDIMGRPASSTAKGFLIETNNGKTKKLYNK